MRGNTEVSVEASARLHLGFVDLTRRRTRQFGSLGLAIDGPTTRVVCSDAPDAPDTPESLTSLVTRVAEGLGIARPRSVVADERIPRHAGLGSGTQRALAVAAAIAAFHGRALDPHELARVTGRGRRSGIGIGAFARGGFLVDGGRTAATTVPPVIARVAFPAPWRIVLLGDPDFEGLSGSSETSAFESLPGMSTAVANELAYLTMMAILPGLLEGDFTAFARAIGRIQDANGDHFASAQSGRYASAKVADAIALLKAAGHAGLGQSSWGPTGFVFARSEASATEIAALVADRFPKAELTPTIARGCNEGASIRTTPSAAQTGDVRAMREAGHHA